MTKDWIIYARVSTDEQAQGISLDAQLTACRAYATARNWQVCGEIIDPGASAATLKREGMQDLLGKVQAGKVAGVIAWRLDRLTRSMKDLTVLLELFQEIDCGIVSVTESLDTTTPMGKFVIHLLGAIAQWERETIGSRVKNAIAHAKGQGYWLGSAIPAGLKVIPEGKRKKLTRGDQADEVAKAWPAVLAGASLLDICKQFKADGIRPTQKPGIANKRGWTPATVRNLLISKQCIGLLVDPSTYTAVINTLSKRSRPGRKGQERIAKKTKLAHSPLCGLIRCPLCKAAMIQVAAKGNGGWYRYFRCTARVKSICTQKDQRCEPIEQAVIDAFINVFKPESAYVSALKQDYKNAAARLADIKLERLKLASERDQLSARIAQLTLGQQIGTTAWNEAMRTLGQEIDRVDRRLSVISGLESAGSVDVANLDAVAERWHRGAQELITLPPPEQASYLQAFVNRVTVGADNIELELYRPESVQSGSFISDKKLPRMDGKRTVHVLISR